MLARNPHTSYPRKHVGCSYSVITWRDIENLSISVPLIIRFETEHVPLSDLFCTAPYRLRPSLRDILLLAVGYAISNVDDDEQCYCICSKIRGKLWLVVRHQVNCDKFEGDCPFPPAHWAQLYQESVLGAIQAIRWDREMLHSLHWHAAVSTHHPAKGVTTALSGKWKVARNWVPTLVVGRTRVVECCESKCYCSQAFKGVIPRGDIHQFLGFNINWWRSCEMEQCK